MSSKRERLWQDLTRRTPRLLEDPHFTPESVRRFFERVYDAGFDHGMTASREMPRSGGSLFEQMFGQR